MGRADAGTIALAKTDPVTGLPICGPCCGTRPDNVGIRRALARFLFSPMGACSCRKNAADRGADRTDQSWRAPASSQLLTRNTKRPRQARRYSSGAVREVPRTRLCRVGLIQAPTWRKGFRRRAHRRQDLKVLQPKSAAGYYFAGGCRRTGPARRRGKGVRARAGPSSLTLRGLSDIFVKLKCTRRPGGSGDRFGPKSVRGAGHEEPSAAESAGPSCTWPKRIFPAGRAALSARV